MKEAIQAAKRGPGAHGLAKPVATKATATKEDDDDDDFNDKDAIGGGKVDKIENAVVENAKNEEANLQKALNRKVKKDKKLSKPPNKGPDNSKNIKNIKTD